MATETDSANRCASGAETAQAYSARSIAVAGRELAISWGDGHESQYPFDWLRRRCPCPTCRSAAKKAVVERSVGDVTIARLSFVGNYGVEIAWSDGHDGGIYAFELLRRSCPRLSSSGTPSAGR